MKPLLALLLLLVGGPAMAAESSAPLFVLDHLLVGAADLDRVSEQVAASTGVRPVYGGKHPVGTHNALLALGDHTYLELIAAQPGQRPLAFGVDFTALATPAAVGWAIAVTNLAAARAALAQAGYRLSEPLAGSRTTPAGQTLAWHTFVILGAPEPAPFFIAWSADTAHPATTSPPGCRLEKLTLKTPDVAALEKLNAVLGLTLTIERADSPGQTIELACPAGKVRY
ncbi:MAG: VOC family protein [Thermoanaerobaculia bacterium]|nr:VOC family protein [Thermoanaerobaculia bacterium]